MLAVVSYGLLIASGVYLKIKPYFVCEYPAACMHIR